MKKIFHIITTWVKIVVVLVMIVFFCVVSFSVIKEEVFNTTPKVVTEVEGTLVKIKGDNVCSEWVDTITGVHYFYTPTGGLVMRLNADGSPYCGGEKCE